MNTDKHGSTDLERLPGALRSRRFVVVAVGAILLSAAGIFLYDLLQPEPTWNGRRLSSWLNDLRTDTQQSRANQDQAGTAVSAIGAKGIPLFLTWMNSGDSPVKKVVYGILPRRLQLRWHPQWAYDRQWMAATAFGFLGTNAESVVPELSRLLGSGKRGRFAAAALAGIGMPAFPVLTNLFLQQQTAEDSAYGLTGFGDMAMPILINALTITNRTVHQAAFAGVHFSVYNQYIWKGPDRSSRIVRSSMSFNQSNIGVAMAAHTGREKALLVQTLDQCLVSTNQEVATAARLVKMQLGL